MLHKSENGIEWLEFEHLAEEKKLIHRIFLKNGGFSQNEYGSLNCSYQVGDNPSHVDANMEKISNILGIKTFIRGKLNHGNRVVSIEENNHSPN